MYKNILYIYNELFFCMDSDITPTPHPANPHSEFKTGVLTGYVSYISHLTHTLTHRQGYTL